MIVLLLAGLGWSQDYAAPFSAAHYGHFYPTAYYDHAGRDWACGRIRYSGHRGSDYGGGGFAGMDAGRTIVAAADGTVTTVHDGEFDRCTSGGCSGGSGYGNYVRIRHADGKHTYYAHLKRWSVRVRPGDRVSCGQALGQMGSSGYSTGPHLHFETRTAGNARVDPFHGSCSGPPSYWVSQGSHGRLPGRACEVRWRDRDGDGHDERTDCNDNNRTIYPGAPEVCDDGIDQNCDGSDRRSELVFVDGDRDGWGAASRRICRNRAAGEVTRDGDCDDGDPTVHPGATELCDGRDNDCDGLIDDGAPQTLGDPPPAIAARLRDVSLPGAVPAGSTAEVWAVVDNVGSTAWEAGSLWMTTSESALRHEESWPAWDIVATLDHRVEPGQSGTLRGRVQAPDQSGATLTETWSLATSNGTPSLCPTGSIDVQVRVLPAPVPVHSPPGSPELVGCSALPRVAGSALPLALVAVVLGLRRRRRERL